MARTTICDQCGADIPMGGGYIFYSTGGYGQPERFQETGNLMLCEECTNRICISSDFADWVDNIEELRKLPSEKIILLSLLRKRNASGIATVCKKLGLSPIKAKAKAREFAKGWWQNQQQSQLEAVKFWNPEKAVCSESLNKPEEMRKWWQFWK